MSEFSASAYEDYLIIRDYQRSHDGRLPGGTKEDMATLEAQDRQTLIDAMDAVGAHAHAVELDTPIARLATWAYVDYMKDEIAQAGSPHASYYPSLDMEQMRRTA